MNTQPCDSPEKECAPERLFDQVYAAHQKALHAYLFGRTGESDLTLDLLQELFLRAWRHIHVLQGMEESQHGYWLFSIAKNLLTDHYRKRATRTTIDQQLRDESTVMAAAPATPHEAWSAHEQVQQVDRAMQRLPEELRTVLLMQVLGNMNSTQIGAALERPAGTVRYQISAARKRLAEEMKLLE